MSYLKNYGSLGASAAQRVIHQRIIGHGPLAQGGILDSITGFFAPSSPEALVKQLQRETNRYAGLAFPTAIGEDGKIGTATVAAVRGVASFLIKQGAVQSDSFVQSGASANAAYIQAHVSEYIAIFDKEANRRGLVGKAPPKSTPAPQPQLPLPGDPGAPPPPGFMDQLAQAGVSMPMLLGGVGLAIYLAKRKKGKSGGKRRRR